MKNTKVRIPPTATPIAKLVIHEQYYIHPEVIALQYPKDINIDDLLQDKVKIGMILNLLGDAYPYYYAEKGAVIQIVRIENKNTTNAFELDFSFCGDVLPIEEYRENPFSFSTDWSAISNHYATQLGMIHYYDINQLWQEAEEGFYMDGKKESDSDMELLRKSIVQKSISIYEGVPLKKMLKAYKRLYHNVITVPVFTGDKEDDDAKEQAQVFEKKVQKESLSLLSELITEGLMKQGLSLQPMEKDEIIALITKHESLKSFEDIFYASQNR